MTPEQKENVALNIADNGLTHYLLRFLNIPTERNRKDGIGWRKFFDYWGTLLMMVLMAAIGIGVAVIAPRNELAEIFGIVGVVLIPSAICYFLSIIVVVFKYWSWLRSIHSLSQTRNK